MDIVVSKDKLKRYLDLLTLTGQNQNKEAIFNVAKDKIVSLIKSPSNAVGVKGVLTGKFEDIGEIGVDDLPLLTNSISLSQTEDVKLGVKQNKIVVSATKTKASLMLRKSDYVKNSVPEETFKTYVDRAKGNEFVLTKEDLQYITQAYNLIKSDTVKISGKDKSITFLFGKNDNQVDTEISLKTGISAFDVTVDSFFIFLLILIGDDPITISIKNDVPIITVHYKTTNIEVTYLVAPMAK